MSRDILDKAVRASKKLIIANKKSTSYMDEVHTLPLPPQRVAQKANLSFKHKFPYISVIDEASDFKFGMQLEFAKAHHQFSPEEKVVVALG